MTEIEWASDDALPFAFCLSARLGGTRDGAYVDDVSVALGNIVLADHGAAVSETLDAVPADRRRRVAPGEIDRCDPEPQARVATRFRPLLTKGPLTHTACVSVTVRNATGHAVPARWACDPDAPAVAALRWEMDDVRPAITLTDPDGEPWQAERDLLSSDASMRNFVVEVEDASRTTLRFGDDDCGMRPNEGTVFAANYRIGNGTEGNVGRRAIAHVVSGDSAFTEVTNPLAACGGVDPESIEEVRQRAPYAFRTLERAVTLDDYADVAQRFAGVQKAVTQHRWTGSWYTVFLAIDRLGGAKVDAPFIEGMRRHLERFRLAGRDVEIGAPVYVPLEIEMRVCTQPFYQRSEVMKALLDVFSADLLPDGTRGVFHPDNFSFGDSVYPSRIYARAQEIPGVASAQVTKFQRQGQPSTSALDSGVLRPGWREIARLDNDPNFPERGVFAVTPELHA